MSKIICDICGTSYPDTAECCPICGYTRDYSEELMGEDLLAEEGDEAGAGYYASRKKEIFDFDEVNADTYEDPQADEEEDEEEEDVSGPNTFVVILLTVLIAGLLLAAGFIFFRYFLPNMGEKEEIPVTTEATYTEAVEEQTEPTVPCVNLTMSSGASAQLSAPGQNFLLHVQALPENTTDKIIYTSANEGIATVTEDGRITAVAEGETTIFIACGQMTLECPVVVHYVEETEPPVTQPVVVQAEDVEPNEETEDAPAAGETGEEPSAEVTEPATAPANSGVVLKLKKTDVRLGVYYQFTLELDCDLKPDQVQWSSEHPHIAKVDENGVVTAVKTGTTAIIVKYGDQEVQCIVRCV